MIKCCYHSVIQCCILCCNIVKMLYTVLIFIFSFSHQIMMSAGNISFVKDFYIVVFLGFSKNTMVAVAALLLLVYVCILVGNGIFIALFTLEKCLHKPMYYIILNLVVSDLLFSTTTLPKIIARYWFQAGSISFTGCFIQMYLCTILVSQFCYPGNNGL